MQRFPARAAEIQPYITNQSDTQEGEEEGDGDEGAIDSSAIEGMGVSNGLDNGDGQTGGASEPDVNDNGVQVIQ